MPYVKTPWVANVTPVTAVSMNNIEAGIAVRDGYGTTLPGSPVDGQEFVLVDSVIAPSYTWRLRYNPSHAMDAYKWEFIGGSPWHVRSAADPGTLPQNWTALPSPTVTAPNTGMYLVTSGLDQGGNSAAGLLAQGPNVSTAGSALFYGQAAAAAGGVCGWPVTQGPMQLNAGQIVKVFAYFGGGTFTVNTRWLSVLPVSLS